MESETNNPLSLRDFYYVLFKHKVSITMIVFAILITVVVGLYIWPETYEASAKLLVKLGRENVSIPTAPPSSQQKVLTTDLTKEDINSEIMLLSNRFIIEKVVEQLDTDFLFPEAVQPQTFFKRIKFEIRRITIKLRDLVFEVLYRIDFLKRLSPYESAVLKVQKKLSAKQVRDSDVIEVQFRWSNPYIAEAVLDTLIGFYFEHHLDVHKANGGYEFFQKQVEMVEKRLRDSEDKLQLMKERQGITSYEHQRRLLLEQADGFQASLKNTESEFVEANTRINELRAQLSLQSENIELAKEIERNPLIVPLKTKLLELELEKERLEKKYIEDNRLVVSVKDQIEKVNSKLSKEEANVLGKTTTGVNVVHLETKKQLLLEEVRFEALNIKKKQLEKNIESCMKELEELNAHETELKRLDRQIQIDEENYLLYRRQLEETRISDTLDSERIVNVRMIDPVTNSFIPVKPRKLLIFSLGVMLALIVGIGFAFLSEYLDHSIETAEDIKRYLDLPLLASIREMKR